MYPFFYLAQKLEKLGHRAATIDTDDIKKFDAVIFLDFPTLKNTYFKRLIKLGLNNMYLVILESPLIKPDNLNHKNHKYFKKIFTWSDGMVDNKKYFKLNYSHRIPEKLDFDTSKKEKLCAMIAGNKLDHGPGELYSERIKAIRWFEKNHREDFDLFGKGWDRYNFQGKFLGINIARLNRLTFLTKLLAPNYPSYRGKVKSKNETYKKYKFSICYENAEGYPGYITEKIIDCFLAGCVPVYLGDADIKAHIPENTFVDKRKFSSYEYLYNYLKNMSDKEYSGYLEAIKSFVGSGEFYPFSAEYFAETIIREVVK